MLSFKQYNDTMSASFHVNIILFMSIDDLNDQIKLIRSNIILHGFHKVFEFFRLKTVGLEARMC